MNRLKITGWIAAVSSALILSVSCGDGDDSAVQSAEQTIQAPVFRTGKSTLPTYTTAVGTLEPYNRAQLSTRVMGNVKEVMVEEGDRVRRGQALLRLDMRDLSSRIEQSEAMLVAAKSQQENAEAYYNRIKNLYEDKSATKQALDNATAQYESAGHRREPQRAVSRRRAQTLNIRSFPLLSPGMSPPAAWTGATWPRQVYRLLSWNSRTA